VGGWTGRQMGYTGAEMGMAVVFWRTTGIDVGQKRHGRLVLRNAAVSGPRALIELLFPDGVPKTEVAIRLIMADASRRFNGSYLRAEVQE